MTRLGLRSISIAVVAGLAVSVVPATVAFAQKGVRGFEIEEDRREVEAKGPGFDVELDKRGIDVDIDEEDFGIPEAGFPIEVNESDLGAAGPLRPFVCENGTYRIQTGIFRTTARISSRELRPPPFPEGFNSQFPISTFVGELEGTVIDENGETLRLVFSDLVHERLTARDYASTNPLHGFFVDRRGRVRDRISLVGRFNSRRDGQDAVYAIEDRGTCRQFATVAGQPNVVVSGPFFVFPFNAPLTTPDDSDDSDSDD
jgi:hypothetical protein